MALSIKDEATDKLVRRYASLHRVSYTRAVKKAVTDAMVREGQPIDEDEEHEAARLDFLDRVGRVREMLKDAPILDPRPYREILYDEHGLPI